MTKVNLKLIFIYLQFVEVSIIELLQIFLELKDGFEDSLVLRKHYDNTVRSPIFWSLSLYLIALWCWNLIEHSFESSLCPQILVFNSNFRDSWVESECVKIFLKKIFIFACLLNFILELLIVNCKPAYRPLQADGVAIIYF